MEINRVVTISWNCYGTQIDNRAKNTEGAGGQLLPNPVFVGDQLTLFQRVGGQNMPTILLFTPADLKIFLWPWISM